MNAFALTDFSGNSAFAAYGIVMKSFDVAWGLLAIRWRKTSAPSAE